MKMIFRKFYILGLPLFVDFLRKNKRCTVYTPICIVSALKDPFSKHHQHVVLDDVACF
jgi:hypothetical protein